jgi:hypothetical protein
MAGSLGGAKRTLKKKAVVAISRQLIVICGGCKTGRATAQQLYLVMIGG